MSFGVFAELMPIIIATRSNRIWRWFAINSLSYRFNSGRGNTIFCPFITFFRAILTRSNSFFYRLISFNSNFKIFDIFSEFHTIIVISRTNIIICWRCPSQRSVRWRWNESLARSIF
jgi:hypothetical protein